MTDPLCPSDWEPRPGSEKSWAHRADIDPISSGPGLRGARSARLPLVGRVQRKSPPLGTSLSNRPVTPLFMRGRDEELIRSDRAGTQTRSRGRTEPRPRTLDFGRGVRQGQAGNRAAQRADAERGSQASRRARERKRSEASPGRPQLEGTSVRHKAVGQACFRPTTRLVMHGSGKGPTKSSAPRFRSCCVTAPSAYRSARTSGGRHGNRNR